jgi:hypothetical protein
MPMQRSLYPENWEEIALKVKEEAQWKCEECNRECRRPSESWSEFVNRVAPSNSELRSEIADKPVRFVLTTAHLNHRPSDCARSNLKALCSVCHCRMDLRAMPRKKMLKLERQGQLRLFD